MEKNLQSLRLKIDHYCELNNLSQTAFAAKLDMSRQALGNMLSGRQKFTENFFLGIMEHTDINLHDLFNGSKTDMNIVSEPAKPYILSDDSKYKKALQEIGKILEKTQI